MLLQDRLYATLANKELTKKMSPTNAKALNTMRQRLRKHNPGFSEQIEKFRANPESEEEPDRQALLSWQQRPTACSAIIHALTRITPLNTMRQRLRTHNSGVL